MLCRNSRLQRRQPRISWQTVWKYFAVTTSFRMLGQTKLDWWTVAISPSVAESDVDFVNPTKNNRTRISISLEPSRASRQSFRIKTRSERFYSSARWKAMPSNHDQTSSFHWVQCKVCEPKWPAQHLEETFRFLPFWPKYCYWIRTLSNLEMGKATCATVHTPKMFCPGVVTTYGWNL